VPAAPARGKVDVVRLVARNESPGVLRIAAPVPTTAVSGQGPATDDDAVTEDSATNKQSARRSRLSSGSFRGNVPRRVDALDGKVLGAPLPRRALGLQLAWLTVMLRPRRSVPLRP